MFTLEAICRQLLRRSQFKSTVWMQVLMPFPHPTLVLLSIMLHSYSYTQPILLFFHTHKERQHNTCEGRDAFSDKEMWWSLKRGQGAGQMGKPYRHRLPFGRRFCTLVFNSVLQWLSMLINSSPETNSIDFAVCT